MLDLAIVIVSYNTKDLLRTCLRSVYASEGDFAYTASPFPFLPHCLSLSP